MSEHTRTSLCAIGHRAHAISESAVVAYYLHSHNAHTAQYHEARLIEGFDALAPMIEALRASHAKPQVETA